MKEISKLLCRDCSRRLVKNVKLARAHESDEYHVKTAKTVKEACELAEAGFEYFTAMDDVQIFRKRK